MSRNYCFTLNNYTDDDKRTLEEYNYSYLIYGTEVGESGTPHLQGYIEFDYPKKLPALKKQLGNKYHWESRKGTQKQAIAYCKKDGTYVELGTKKNQGRRTDLEELKKIAKESGIRKCFEDKELNYTELRFLEKYLSYCEEGNTEKPEVIWYYGESGCGKTRAAFKEHSENTYYKNSTKWWDGYDSHTTVIWDDFRGSDVQFTELLKIIDRYPHRVECKGGGRMLKVKKFIFTSIKHPQYIYNKEEEPLKQLLRRIDKCVYMGTQVRGNTDPALEYDQDET